MAEDDENADSVEAAKREALCRRCGLCCHEKIRIGDQVVITDVPCKHLDVDTKLCKIYGDRKELEPRCLSAEESAKGNGLPGDCPYVKGIADYLAPHLLGEHPEYERIVDLLYPDRKKKKPDGDS